VGHSSLDIHHFRAEVPQNARVQLDEFVAALGTLTGDDVHLVAKSLDLESLTDEVDWWRATIAIDRAIRHARCSRQAARAAAQAIAVVQERANNAGIDLPDTEVTRVARAAADVARGLTVGPSAEPLVRLLLEPWTPIVAFA
jgi:hypothetical protein